MAAAMVRTVIKMLAGDETERVAGCRLTHGPILWLCRCWTEAGMSMLSSEIGKIWKAQGQRVFTARETELDKC
jgi:hypothetical protein